MKHLHHSLSRSGLPRMYRCRTPNFAQSHRRWDSLVNFTRIDARCHPYSLSLRLSADLRSLSSPVCCLESTSEKILSACVCGDQLLAANDTQTSSLFVFICKSRGRFVHSIKLQNITVSRDKCHESAAFFPFPVRARTKEKKQSSSSLTRSLSRD